MALFLYNTLSRKKEKFIALNEEEVKIYSCGPTVNDIPHLGHAKQQVSFDVLRRYLEFLGYKVKYVSNVTDVEDKIIKKAKESGRQIEEITEENYRKHMQDYRDLNIEVPNVQPRATDYIDEMIDLVKRLQEKGYAYVIEGDGVYFDLSKFKDYGKLSGQNIEELQEGRRVDNENKRNKNDFVLWKFSKEGEPKWDSPWGEGRPGWHIECSAMSANILGLPLDIHCGGQDLIFPHHEDEIAQSEAGYQKKFVNYWIHNGMVNVEGEKMSKSTGNFKTIKDLLEEYDAMIVRYFVVFGHYRKPVDFTKEALDDAKNSYERIKRLSLEVENDNQVNQEYLERFKEAMDDDINTPRAIAVLWEVLKDKEAKGRYQTIKKMDEVFALKLLEKEKTEIPEEIKGLAEEREKAREEKDWEKSDRLREEIKERGWKIADTKQGYEVSRA